MSDDELRTRIRTFLEPQLNGRPLADSDDIFAAGYVNSLFTMQLARFVQRDLGVQLAPADMDLQNFRSVDAIVGLAQAKASTSVHVP